MSSEKNDIYTGVYSCTDIVDDAAQVTKVKVVIKVSRRAMRKSKNYATVCFNFNSFIKCGNSLTIGVSEKDDDMVNSIA